MVRAHKIRLNPTAEQVAYFMKAAGTARYAYNWAVAHWRDAGDKKPGARALKKQFNANKPEWAYEVTKCAAEGGFMDFAQALTHFYDGRANIPQFKSRKRGHVAFYLANDKFDVSGHFIKVPKLGLVNMTERLRFAGKILGARITKEASWWYVAITVEMPETEKQPPPKTCGVDVGVVRLATLSDGRTWESARPLKRSLNRLARLQRQVEKKEVFLVQEQKGKEYLQDSRNRAKIKAKIGRLHKQVRDIRDDLLHKLTTEIAHQYGFVVVEDLNVAGMVKNHHLAQALQDSALGKLIRLLERKVEANGGTLVKVDRFYPSSKTCCRCGHQRDELKLSERIFICGNSECGVTLDRDLNAAINLLQEGLRLTQF